VAKLTGENATEISIDDRFVLQRWFAVYVVDNPINQILIRQRAPPQLLLIGISKTAEK